MKKYEKIRKLNKVNNAAKLFNIDLCYHIF